MKEKLGVLGSAASQADKDKASDTAVDQAKDQAYDQARKEFYRQRHDDEVEVRVAREEAHATGAYFGLSQNEIGMQIENRTFDQWRTWAEGQVVLMEQAKSAAYSGGAGGAGGAGGSTTKDDGAESVEGGQSNAIVEGLQRSISGSQSGQKAFGGAATRP